MSLVKKEANIKYEYHRHTASWNELFASFFSYEELETKAIINLLQGYFYI